MKKRQQHRPANRAVAATENGDPDREEVATDEPERQQAALAPKSFADIVDEVVRQLEIEFAPTISADDPIRAFLRGNALLLEAALKENMLIAAVGMAEATAAARAELDEAGAAKLKKLNEELRNWTQQAIKAVKAARNDANTHIIGALVELRAMVDELRPQTRVQRWRERIIGIMIAGGLVVVGIVIGRML